MKRIFVEISRKCNKNCYYCYNSKITKKFLKPNTKNIIDSIIQLSEDSKNLNLIFSGGEPSYNLNEIKTLISELDNAGYKTNITLISNIESLNKEFLLFLRDHKPYLVLSYNEKTFTIIKNILPLLTKKKIFVRFTITPENISTIKSEIEKCLQEKIFVGISPAYGIIWEEPSLQSLTKLYLGLVENRYRHYIYDFEKILINNNKQRKICKSLDHPNTIDFYGNIHSCHRAIYFPNKDIMESHFTNECKFCSAYRFCTPCIFKDIPGDGCKIRVAISPAYDLIYRSRRFKMKKRVKSSYKGRKIEIPDAVVKRYLKTKKTNSSKKKNRNFYELGESDCY